jgi:hypothetical protein
MARAHRIVCGFASWKVLAALVIVAVVLLAVQLRMAASEVALATGPPNAAQRQFFEQAASRPDLELFFKSLSPRQRLAMAERLADHPTQGATKTAARLLSTLDEHARERLVQSLTRLARENPDLVAAELGRTGSFEQAGLLRALDAAGDSGARAAAQALLKPELRAQASAFLVRSEQDVEGELLPMLGHTEPDVRAAASETLGRRRSAVAVEPILKAFRAAQGEERRAHLIALARIGSPGAEFELLAESREFNPDDVPRELWAGLGRIATPRALKALEAALSAVEGARKEAVEEALTLAGDAALRYLKDSALRVRLAGRVRSPLADEILRGALVSPEAPRQAIEAAQGRPEVAPALLPPGFDARHPSVPFRTAALASTEPGRAILAAIPLDSPLGGWARRALILAGSEG